jgi:hypothetical protein
MPRQPLNVYTSSRLIGHFVNLGRESLRLARASAIDFVAHFDSEQNEVPFLAKEWLAKECCPQHSLATHSLATHSLATHSLATAFLSASSPARH